MNEVSFEYSEYDPTPYLYRILTLYVVAGLRLKSLHGAPHTQNTSSQFESVLLYSTTLVKDIGVELHQFTNVCRSDATVAMFF